MSTHVFYWCVGGITPPDNDQQHQEYKMELAIKQSKTGQTRLLVTFPYSVRVGLTQVSKKTGLSQQSLIRSAVAALLSKHQDAGPPKKTKRTRTRKAGA
jgi:hypothetical protein